MEEKAQGAAVEGVLVPVLRSVAPDDAGGVMDEWLIESIVQTRWGGPIAWTMQCPRGHGVFVKSVDAEKAIDCPCGEQFDAGSVKDTIKALLAPGPFGPVIPEGSSPW